MESAFHTSLSATALAALLSASMLLSVTLRPWGLRGAVLMPRVPGGQLSWWTEEAQDWGGSGTGLPSDAKVPCKTPPSAPRREQSCEGWPVPPASAQPGSPPGCADLPQYSSSSLWIMNNMHQSHDTSSLNLL